LTLLLALLGGAVGCDGPDIFPVAVGVHAPPQGDLIWTGTSTDLALEGAGLLVLQDAGRRVYVRGGHFQVDPQGVCTDVIGRALLGRPVSRDGAVTLTDDSLHPVRMGPAVIGPHATSRIRLGGRFMSNASPQLVPFDPQNPTTTGPAGITLTIYDATGRGHDVTVYYQSGGNGMWLWSALLDAGEVGGQTGHNLVISQGKLMFTQPNTVTVGGGAMSELNFPGASSRQIIYWSFDLGIAEGDVPVFLMQQDGYSAGPFSDFQVLADGSVLSRYETGGTVLVARLPLAMFKDFRGLQQLAMGGYVATTASGAAVLGPPNQGGRGSTMSEFIETDPLRPDANPAP
jgi:flagellar hook protein FlgE